jgi:hypothetical protein
MTQIKISQLPVGVAENNAVVPATNAAGTQTNKIKLTDIANLPHNHDNRYYTEAEINSILSNYAVLVNGSIPAAQLPSYVDDVITYPNLSSFPSSGEVGKIYVAVNTNKVYRWSGISYIEISPSPGSTDSVTEGSINKYYTDARASAAAPVQSVNGLTGIVTIDRLAKDNKTVVLGSNGSLTLPNGSILSETNNAVALSPPTAVAGQSLVIRPTAALWTISSSNYIEYGNPITIVVTLQNWAYFGTVNYTISGPGVTPQSLGRALTGKLTFVSTTGPDAESITWTIPANSSITEFTLTLTSVDGTRSGPEIADANLYPALYYNFEESNGMPTGQFVTVTNNGISSSEHSHVHLISGDPSTVDIYLGDDDQYVKIEKDGGDVVVGTKSEAVVNRLTLITNGTGYAVTPNDVAVLGGSGTGMRVNYANNGDSVIVVVLNTLGTGYQDGDILTLSGGNGNCTFRYNNHNAIYNNWTFGTDGRLTLPIDGDILDSNGTSVLGGGSTTVVSSSYSSTINTDAGAGDIFDITLTGNTTLANPTNPVNGKTLRWRITQDSTGSRTVTLGNKFNIPSSATSPLPFSTAANKMDTLAATYHAGRDKWDIVAFVPGY